MPRADSLTTFVCWLSWNLRASTFWNPLGLCRLVMGLLYLFFTLIFCIQQVKIKPKQNAKGTQSMHSTGVIICPVSCCRPGDDVMYLGILYSRLAFLATDDCIPLLAGCAYQLGEWSWRLHEIYFVTDRHSDRRVVRRPVTSLVIGRLF